MQIIGFFCHDIRAESAGTETIVGAFPDNMNVPSLPGAIPQAAVYIRILIGLDEKPETVRAVLKTAWGDTPIGEATEELLRKAQSSARESGLPIAGAIMRSLIAPFPINQRGLITVVAIVNGQEQICAVMSVKSNEAISTASPPRGEQFQPASPQT